MKTARLFANGRSQAVRLPRECRFDGDEVYVRRLGKAVILLPIDDPWATMLEGLEGFDDDFLADRGQPGTQKRKKLP